MNEVQLAEARAAYGFQIMMENVHSETYSLLIDTLVKEEREKTKLFEAINNFPCIKKKQIGLLNGLMIKGPHLQLDLLPSRVLKAFFFLGHFVLFTG